MSYGAYTFCMATVLRENRSRGVNLPFADLNELVKAKLHRLKYDQTPNLLGAEERCAQPVPWGTAGRGTSGKRVSPKRIAARRTRAKGAIRKRRK
jgi:hypothetical protein